MKSTKDAVELVDNVLNDDLVMMTMENKVSFLKSLHQNNVNTETLYKPKYKKSLNSCLMKRKAEKPGTSKGKGMFRKRKKVKKKGKGISNLLKFE